LLIQADSRELGDFRLDPIEGVAQKREECIRMAGKKRLVNQDDLEDPSRTMGPRLQFSEVVSKLRRLVPSLRVLDGSPGNVALYAPRNSAEFAGAQRGWQNDRDIFFLRYKYVGGFPKHELHEYSGLDVEEYTRLPNKEIRGWRSVLIMLLQQGLVSYRAVIKEFGDVGTDKRGWRWNEQTQKWRNNPEVAFT
jgi:hypothetical protein